MTVTLLELNEDYFAMEFVDGEYVSSTDLDALKKHGFTHGVLFSMFNYDDETDFPAEGARVMNMYRCLASGAAHWAMLDEGEKFRLDEKENCIILPTLSFRLALWRPLETAFGFYRHEEDEAYDKQWLKENGHQPVD